MFAGCSMAPAQRFIRHCLMALGALLMSAVTLPSLAQDYVPPEVAAHPATIDLAGQKLQRNGAGIRYKAIFKVYSAALYLEKPVTSLEEISKLKGPKRVTVTMLRTINSAEMGKLLTRGIQDNMDPNQFSKLIPGVMRMSDVYTRNKELKPGEYFSLDWIPGKGMVLSVNGIPDPAEFPEPEFYQAMLGMWLGPRAADGRLKQALLGQPAL